jgi:hypothetical protein
MSQAAHKSFYDMAYNNTDTQPFSAYYEQVGSNLGGIRPEINVTDSVQDLQLSENAVSQANKEDESVNVVTDDEDNDFALPRKSFHQFPQTPSVAGRKRKAGEELLGEIRSSSKKSPGSLLKILNARDGNSVSLTQAFGNTQADTSPFANGVKSDPVFDRPSPEFVARFTSPTSPLFNNIILNDLANGNENTSPRQDLHKEGNEMEATQAIREPTAHKSSNPRYINQTSHTTHPIPILGNSDLEDIQELMSPRDIEQQTVKSSPECIQVPRSSRNVRSNAGYDHHNSLCEDIDRIEATPIQSLDHNRKSNSLPPTQVSDRITDSQYNTQKLLNVNLASSPLLRQRTSHPKLTYHKLPIDKNRREILSSETHDALVASSPIRPLKGSFPGLLESDSHNVDNLKQPHGTLHKIYDDSGLPNDTQDQTVHLSTMRKNSKSSSKQGYTAFQINELSKAKKATNIRDHQSNLTGEGDSMALNGSKELPQEIETIKLSNVAAESSNPRRNMTLDFDAEHRTEAEKAHDEQFSGSSPVAPKIRNRLRGKTRNSPSKHALKQDFSRNNSSTNMELSASTTSTRDPQHVLDFDISLHDPSIPRLLTNINSKGSLARPKKFLGEMNRRKKAKANCKTISLAKTDIFEVEESQSRAVPNDNDPLTSEVCNTSSEFNTTIEGNVVVDVSALPIRFPDRIFVFWPGPYNACFPASCLRVLQAVDEPITLDIIDDGGTREQIHVGKMVFKLQLRRGDIVKVEVPNLNRKRYLVIGFKDPYPDSDQVQTNNEIKFEHIPKTDIYGHQTVILIPKGRDSIPGSTDFSTTIDVPISKIKLCRSEFVKFEDRTYIPTGSIEALLKVRLPLSNPSRSPSLANIPTSAISAVDKASQVFSNMCFAISLRSDEEDKKKNRLTSAISRNGGHVLERDLGFEDIFVASSFPTYCNAETLSTESLVLSDEFKGLGFTALIADEHSRTPKYMQALSLNIPILHYRWIDDCIATGKALTWGVYILPAGESVFLSGAIRSRLLAPYDPLGEYGSLKEVLTRRNKIFQNKSILFIRSRNTVTERKRKTCMFLLMALGANEIGLVSDVSEAKDRIRNQTWDFVYANDDERNAQYALGIGPWQVLAHETVVQSLILGNFFTSDR